MVEQSLYSRFMEITAQDIMTDYVETIPPDMLIGELAHIMLRKGFNGFPVVEQGEVIGIVTFTDLFNLLHTFEESEIDAHSDKLHERIAHLKKWPVSKIMSQKVKTVEPTTTLDEIIEIVVTRKIHTFPVVDKGKLVGILGREDVLNATFTYG